MGKLYGTSPSSAIKKQYRFVVVGLPQARVFNVGTYDIIMIAMGYVLSCFYGGFKVDSLSGSLWKKETTVCATLLLDVIGMLMP